MTQDANTTSASTPATGDALCVCPMCHTVAAAMTGSALDSGGYWLCIRCGQEWDARRLAARAAYGRYAAQTYGRASAGVASMTPYPISS
jgi:hypothetical protein